MKLSIITVNKDNAPGLEKTCLSIAAQTYRDFEWVIIDGASGDSSVEVIKKYAHHAHYWVSEKDSGVYNAINKGILSATGEYLLFLNSGDFLLHPWTLQEAIDEINASEYADVYFCDTVLSTWEVWKYPQNITLKFLLNGWLNHQSCLINRKLFSHQLYNENYRIISDWYFFITEIIRHNITFHHINTNIVLYDVSGVSSTQKRLRESEAKMVLNELHIKRMGDIPLIKFIKLIKYILPYGFYKLFQIIKKKIKRR
jgi:glycosyltransferase involved in cell wall biosynthesis